MENVQFTLRCATEADIAALNDLMESSIRMLLRDFLDPAQIEASHAVMGLDTQLIEDGTYFVLEEAGLIVGSGGWSRRKTLCGGDHSSGRNDAFTDPQFEAVKIRAMYTRPSHARRGIGTIILLACEKAASAAGYRHAELGATLAGVPLYEVNGYKKVESVGVVTKTGVEVPIWRMVKTIGG